MSPVQCVAQCVLSDESPLFAHTEQAAVDRIQNRQLLAAYPNLTSPNNTTHEQSRTCRSYPWEANSLQYDTLPTVGIGRGPLYTRRPINTEQVLQKTSHLQSDWRHTLVRSSSKPSQELASAHLVLPLLPRPDCSVPEGWLLMAVTGVWFGHFVSLQSHNIDHLQEWEGGAEITQKEGSEDTGRKAKGGWGEWRIGIRGKKKRSQIGGRNGRHKVESSR